MSGMHYGVRRTGDCVSLSCITKRELKAGYQTKDYYVSAGHRATHQKNQPIRVRLCIGVIKVVDFTGCYVAAPAP